MKTKFNANKIYKLCGCYVIVYWCDWFHHVHYLKTKTFNNYKIAFAYFENL